MQVANNLERKTGYQKLKGGNFNQRKLGKTAEVRFA